MHSRTPLASGVCFGAVSLCFVELGPTRARLAQRVYASVEAVAAQTLPASTRGRPGVALMITWKGFVEGAVKVTTLLYGGL